MPIQRGRQHVQALVRKACTLVLLLLLLYTCNWEPCLLQDMTPHAYFLQPMLGYGIVKIEI